MSADDMLDEHEAGRYLGGGSKPIAPRTLQRQRLEGRGPAFVKIGAAVRYRRSDLDAYIASNRRTSTSDDA
jgi:hypothetical protein